MYRYACNKNARLTLEETLRKWHEEIVISGERSATITGDHVVNRTKHCKNWEICRFCRYRRSY